MRSFSRVVDRYRVRRIISRLIAEDAIVVDTETTDLDGYVVEIAGVDLGSGQVVFDSLINPGVPIAAAAGAVHGICDRDVAAAPRWNELAHGLMPRLQGRPVVAYNAAFDRAVIAREGRRSGQPEWVEQLDWTCAMRLRARFEGTPRWSPLHGGHRALGDCLATRDLLLKMR